MTLPSCSSFLRSSLSWWQVDDYERICSDVFGTTDDPRLKKLKASLSYYQSASEDGYAKNKPALAANKGKKKKQQSQSHIKLASEMDPDTRQQQTQQSQSSQSQEGNAGQKSSKREKEAAGPSVAAAASKSSTTTANDLVERIALDLDQLDLSEAISGERARRTVACHSYTIYCCCYCYFRGRKSDA